MENKKVDNLADTLEAKSPDEIIKEIVLYRKQAKKEDVELIPPVTIYTFSRYSFRGFAIHIKAQKGAEYLLLHVQEDNRTFKDNFLYIPVSQIVAVEVHQASRIASVLSEGSILRTRAGAAPTRLEINKLLKYISDTIQEKHGIRQEWAIAWETVPDDESSNWVVKECFDQMCSVVKTLLSNEAGVEAWGKIKKITLQHDKKEEFIIKKEGNSIVLLVDLTREVRYSIGQELDRQLNRIL